jgi:hypothetical protein
MARRHHILEIIDAAAIIISLVVLCLPRKWW